MSSVSSKASMFPEAMPRETKMSCYLPVCKALARLWAGVRVSHQPSFPGSLILPLLPGKLGFSVPDCDFLSSLLSLLCTEISSSLYYWSNFFAAFNYFVGTCFLSAGTYFYSAKI